MKLWVRRDSDSEEEALKVRLDDDADTSDLIQEVVRLFAFGPENNVSLKASQVSVFAPEGLQLSNRQDLLPFQGGETLVIRPKYGVSQTADGARLPRQPREPAAPTPAAAAAAPPRPSVSVQVTPTVARGRATRSPQQPSSAMRATSSPGVGTPRGRTPQRASAAKGRAAASTPSPSPVPRRAPSAGKPKSPAATVKRTRIPPAVPQRKNEAPVPPPQPKPQPHQGAAAASAPPQETAAPPAAAAPQSAARYPPPSPRGTAEVRASTPRSSPQPVRPSPPTPATRDVSPHIRERVAQALSVSPSGVLRGPVGTVAVPAAVQQQQPPPQRVPAAAPAAHAAPEYREVRPVVAVDPEVAKANVFRKLADIWESLDSKGQPSAGAAAADPTLGVGGAAGVPALAVAAAPVRPGLPPVGRASFPAHEFKPQWGLSVCGVCRVPRALHDATDRPRAAGAGTRSNRSVSPPPDPAQPPTPHHV